MRSRPRYPRRPTGPIYHQRQAGMERSDVTTCRYVTIRYDTIRDATLTRARKSTRVGLIYRTEPTTRKCKTEKTEKQKRIYSEVTVKVWGIHAVSPEEEKEKLQWERGRGVGTAGALTSAMLKPRGRKYLFAPAIFSNIFECCSLNFHSLSLCCLHTIKTSHLVGATGKKVKFSHTRYRALGPELIPVYRQSARR